MRQFLLNYEAKVGKRSFDDLLHNLRHVGLLLCSFLDLGALFHEFELLSLFSSIHFVT